MGRGARGRKQERAGLSRAKPAHGTGRQVQPPLRCPARAHPPRQPRDGGWRRQRPLLGDREGGSFSRLWKCLGLSAWGLEKWPGRRPEAGLLAPGPRVFSLGIDPCAWECQSLAGPRRAPNTETTGPNGPSDLGAQQAELGDGKGWGRANRVEWRELTERGAVGGAPGRTGPERRS